MAGKLSKAMQGEILPIYVAVALIFFGRGQDDFTLPLYARTFGASYIVVGMVSGMLGLTRLFIDLPSGVLTDRIGRIIPLIVGASLYVLAGIMGVISLSIWFLAIAQVFEGIATSLFMTASKAIVLDKAPYKKMGRHMSYLSIAMGAGGIVAPAIAAVLIGAFGYRGPYLLYFGLSFLGTIIILVWLRLSRNRQESSAPATTVIAEGKSTGRERISLLITLKNSKLLVVALIEFTVIVTGQIKGLTVTLWGNETLGIDVVRLGLLSSASSIIGIITTVAGGSHLGYV